MGRCPSPEDVEAIGRDADPVRRNLRITQAYHELSAAMAATVGGAANWCTFAAWASKQAGQTIRGEDLARKIEADLGGAEELGRAVTRVGELARAVGRAADHLEIVAAVREAFSPVRAVERASDAVARGNKKVFDEIGAFFARFIPALDGAAAARDALLATLRPGPPPDGQDLLRAAFVAYDRARLTPETGARAELMLLANLRIGYHEQARLQPEIADALNAPIAAPRDVKARLGALMRGVHRPLDTLVDDLTEAVRRRVRAVITAHFMTLQLPEGQLRLGRDLQGPYPPDLREPTDPELVDLIRRIDPAPQTGAGSGAEDWTDFPQRMLYIYELFRSRQETGSLFGAPFTPAQTLAIAQGRVPDGRL
jgi:hypothetical protein